MKPAAPTDQAATKRMENSQQIALPVPLDGWTITPSIDFITLTMPSRLHLYRLKNALLDPSLTDRANVKVPRPRRVDRDVLTIHDPTLAQLQRLIDTYPNASIFQIEFSIDLRPGGTDPASADELVPVFRWLADTLYPAVATAKRRHCNESGKYALTPLGPCTALTTHLWHDGLQRITHRLYLKTLDQGRPVERPSVRLETTLSMTACSDVCLAKAWQLVTFSKELRRTLASCFQIAAGIKPKRRRMRHVVGTRIAEKAEAANVKESQRVERAWAHQGAMWAVKHSYTIVPDKVAHKRIGDALRRLGDQLACLKLPENSRVTLDQQPPETRMFLELCDRTTEIPIGVAPRYLSVRKKPTLQKKGVG